MPDSNSTEKWRSVVGHEGIYEASNQGRVRSIDRTIESDNQWGTCKSRLKGQTQKEIGDKLGITKEQVCHILKGRRWAHTGHYASSLR